MFNSNKNSRTNAKVFLTRHTSKDAAKSIIPNMRKHSIELARAPDLWFTSSLELQRKLDYNIELAALYSPQGTSSNSPNTNPIFTAVGKEKKGGIFGRFRLHKTDSQATIQFKQRSIESEIEIENYGANEWATFIKMKNGYKRVKEAGYSFTRRIRGDNYCALRSVVFQLLTSCNLLKSILSVHSLEGVLRRLDQLSEDNQELVTEWRFGTNTFLREDISRANSLKECLKTFFEIAMRLNSNNLTYREKREILVQEMNREEGGKFVTDAKLVESVKFFMFLEADRLYRVQGAGGEVPVWFTFLTLRGNSSTLREFFLGQLNKVGDSLGLERVEMCLLSSSISARIKVFLLSSIDKDDFEKIYPSDDALQLSQEIVLCAEDDTHYNVVYNHDCTYRIFY